MEYKLEDFLKIIGDNAQQIAVLQVTVATLESQISGLKAELEATKNGGAE